jgi:diguanylate cyclase (GGDEF)-like protein/PAS domain S-box-containing protein
MRLKRKILLFTISMLAILLLISSAVSIQTFREHYTDALIRGSFGVAHSIESVLNELLVLGLPLHSLTGMDHKLREVVEMNDYIDYAYVVDASGEILFHSQADVNGPLLADTSDQAMQQLSQPTWFSHRHDDGRRFIDICVPLFDGDRRVGMIRLGFPSSVIDDTVMLAVKQQLVNAVVTFTLITILLSIFLHWQVIEPIKKLSRYAESIARAVPYEAVRIQRKDEIGLLSGSLVRMSAKLKNQIEALKSGGQLLEEKVNARTRQLALTNSVLESSNNNLKLALQRERELSEALRHSEERFRMLFEKNKAVMLIIDPGNGKLIDANGVAVEYYGYPREKLLQMKITDINMLSPEEISSEMKRAQQESRSHFYFRHKLSSGEVRDVEVHSGPIAWDDRALLYSIIHDVTDRKQAEAELQHLAHYDALTGLPNRLLKTDRLRQAIARCHRNDASVAVCYLDLDGFKPINDMYGHDVGDMILVETARRLQTSVREGDTVSRIGGDEFVLILTDLSGLEQCCLIVDRILEAVAQPIIIDDQVVEVCASIGLTLYPEDDADADILLRHADQAMYTAKANGKNHYHLFDPVEDRQVRAHKEQLQRLQQALEDEEFVLHYQPKVNMLTCEVIGMEALIRWNHPEQGLLLPGDFLHVLANTDLEVAVGNWVIRRALEQQAELHEAGLALPVSVNISAYHLQNCGFADGIGSILEQLPMRQTGDLEFEILETSSIEDMSNIFHTLISCRSMGIHFSLDDFGTGYSSLAYFHRLPVDSLKIDQTFVQGMLEDPQDLTIVNSVVRLAGAFKHPVIAEGVESLEHASALLKLGCVLGQGYGIARPMPLDAICDWKKRWDSDVEWQDLKCRFAQEDRADVQAAVESHRQWVRRLISSLHQEDWALTIQLDSRHCDFGQWFYGVGYLHYGNLPLYDEIKKYHEGVHELGKELNDLASHGFRQEALKRVDELEAMRDRFIKLIEQLQQVELAAFGQSKQSMSG